MPRSEQERQHNTLDDLSAAREEARRAVYHLARGAGAQMVRRPLYPGSQSTVQDVEPLAGARAARKVELGARTAAAGYIRDAREAGHSWQEIGEALGVVPGGDASQAGETVAEAAYTYAAGNPGTEHARRYGRSFIWHCPSCDKTISDHGLIAGPAEDEQGHAQGCQRLAAATAAWDPDREAEP